ncbi:MAG: hypothetical protein ACERKN_11170 [Velocimicrobium sp.]
MMFWKKRNKNSFYKDVDNDSCKIIGIVGANRGVGVTHVCILLAEYLAIDRGAMVAILECNNHGDFNRMETAFFDKEETPFMLQQIAYYKEVRMDSMDKIVNKKYSYLILDFGDRLVGKRLLLALCQKKILLGVESAWKKDSMEEKMAYFTSEGFQAYYNLSNQGIPFSPLNLRPAKMVQKLFEDILNS